MSNKVSTIFNFNDRLQMESLNQRLRRSHVITSNVANAETPGFRAIGYDFEEQLQELSGANTTLPLKTTNPQHRKNAFTQADGTVTPDVFVRPSESVSNDGNTVDIDHEMTKMAHNQILYKTAVETITRKIGLLKYAIHGGRG